MADSSHKNSSSLTPFCHRRKKELFKYAFEGFLWGRVGKLVKTLATRR